jgi:hypothetical protein
VTDKNTNFSAAATADAVQLGAIIDKIGSDLALREAQLVKLGFGHDSAGNWFKNGTAIPYPPVATASGILPMK